MASNFNSGARHNGHDGAAAPHVGSSRMDMEGGESTEKPDPIADFRAALKGFSDAVTEFGQARVDGIRIAARETLFKVILGVVGGVAAVVFLVVAMVLLLMGLSGAVSRLLNAAPWVGHLIVGTVCVGAPMSILVIKAGKLKKQLLENVRKKYAGRNEIQCDQ